MKVRILLILMAIAGICYGGRSVRAVDADQGPAQDQQADQSAAEEGGGAGSGWANARDANDIWIDHGASTECAQCHGNRPERTSSVEMELVAPVPRLCSTCHEAYAALDGWVHGPVVTGDCLFCHDPHRSTYGSLLTKPIPELCYECHTIETLRLATGHSDESYGPCNDCHESHAGSNRKLLKHSFLNSEAGARYSDEAAYRRPQYTFVDRRSSLAGLRGVRVIPAIERQDVFGRYGLTPDLVKTEVERCLRRRGVTILSDEGRASGRPGLYVYLRLVELHSPGYSNEVGALSGSLGLFLRQTVELISQPSDAQRRLCTATTWDTSAVVVWGTPQIQEGLTNAIDLLVGRFCRDYLIANPADEQPLPKPDAPGTSGRRAGK